MSSSSYPTHAHSNDTQRQGILSPEQKRWVFRADLNDAVGESEGEYGRLFQSTGAW